MMETIVDQVAGDNAEGVDVDRRDQPDAGGDLEIEPRRSVEVAAGVVNHQRECRQQVDRAGGAGHAGVGA